LTLSDLSELPNPAELELMQEVKSGRKTFFYDRHRLASGRTCDVEIYPTALEYLGKTSIYLIIHDVTERKIAEEKSRKHAQEIEILYDASRQISSTLDLKEIHSILNRFITSLMPCDSLFISTYNPQDQMIRCSYAWLEGQVCDSNQLPAIPLEDEGRGTQQNIM
jgi:PAS domain-containing protein